MAGTRNSTSPDTRKIIFSSGLRSAFLAVDARTGRTESTLTDSHNALDVFVSLALMLQYGKKDVFGREAVVLRLHIVDKGQILHLIVLQVVNKIILRPSHCGTASLDSVVEFLALSEDARMAVSQFLDLLVKAGDLGNTILAAAFHCRR